MKQGDQQLNDLSEDNNDKNSRSAQNLKFIILLANIYSVCLANFSISPLPEGRGNNRLSFFPKDKIYSLNMLPKIHAVFLFDNKDNMGELCTQQCLSVYRLHSR